MRIRLLFVFLVSLIFTSRIDAQLDPVSLALRAYQSEDLAKAKEFIDTALTDINYSQQTRTQFFGGFIYKDLYKGDRNSPLGEFNRQKSIDLFLKTKELDLNSEFSEDCDVQLSYFASTLFNDAVNYLETFDFEKSQSFFDKYKELTLITNPSIDFKPRDIEFLMYTASKYSLAFENAPDGAQIQNISDQIITKYEKVLDLDSNNGSANYNLAIHYYNQGVNIIVNMDYDLPFDSLFIIQENVMQLFQKALPYMLKAYHLNPEKKETLQGLSGIYFGLNDIEKSEYYEKEREKLEGGEN